MALLGGCSREAPYLMASREEGGEAPALVRQVVTKDSERSRTIMWRTQKSVKDPAVELRECDAKSADTDEKRENSSPSVVGESFGARTEEFSDDGTSVFIHSVTLTGLVPGRAYEFRLQGEKAWRPLKTDGGGEFKMLIFPDSQSSDGYVGWQKLAADAARRNPDAALFTNMGDLVDNGEDHTQWDAWFRALDGIIDRIPIAPVMGNHETYDLDWKVRLPRAYLAHFDVPENGSDAFGRYYYSFDYGDVHFAVVNTQWYETDEIIKGLLDEELAWLSEDLLASRKKWKIVLMHRDVLRYGIHGRPDRIPGVEELGKILMPIFEAGGVDAVLTAHLHTYRNRGHLKNFSRDAKGPLYILTGVAGNVRYPGLWTDHELDEVIAPQPETANYMTLTATADSLVFECFLPDGTRIDRATISK